MHAASCLCLFINEENIHLSFHKRSKKKLKCETLDAAHFRFRIRPKCAKLSKSINCSPTYDGHKCGIQYTVYLRLGQVVLINCREIWCLPSFIYISNSGWIWTKSVPNNNFGKNLFTPLEHRFDRVSLLGAARFLYFCWVRIEVVSYATTALLIIGVRKWIYSSKIVVKPCKCNH